MNIVDVFWLTLVTKLLQSKFAHDIVKKERLSNGGLSFYVNIYVNQSRLALNENFKAVGITHANDDSESKAQKRSKKEILCYTVIFCFVDICKFKK